MNPIVFFFAIVATTISTAPTVIESGMQPLTNFVEYHDDFEVFPMRAPTKDLEIRHQVIRRDLISQNVTGHAFWVNARTHFHVFPSLHGCPGRTTVSENSKAHGCQLATNLGFFDMKTSDCIGNVISDGHVVQVQDILRASFGTDGKGRFVVGYVNETSARSGEFDQLAQGAIWLVRNMKSFVKEAAEIEHCGQPFIDLHAPRLSLGHDVDGNLLIVETDGIESKDLGLDLHTFADLVMSLGAVNAINVDGGGSVTVVWMDRVCTAGGVGFDPCKDGASWTVEGSPTERPVTTMTCFK